MVRDQLIGTWRQDVYAGKGSASFKWRLERDGTFDTSLVQHSGIAGAFLLATRKGFSGTWSLAEKSSAEHQLTFRIEHMKIPVRDVSLAALRAVYMAGATTPAGLVWRTVFSAANNAASHKLEPFIAKAFPSIEYQLASLDDSLLVLNPGSNSPPEKWRRC